MREKQLQTDKGRIFYWQSCNWHAQADTLFFLPGLTADHSMFDEQTVYFQERYNVLTWDAPAHGKSRPFREFNYHNVAEYMREILDECGVSKVVLVGQFLGGYFAQAFVKRFPDYVKGFVAIGSTPYGLGYYSVLDIWMIEQVGWMAHLYPFEWMKRAMAKQVSTTQKGYENMMQMLAPYTKNELCHLLGLGYAGFLKDNFDLCITCPVQLIVGEKDRTGKVMQYNKAWARRTEYPLEIIKGAAHNVNVDKPQEVNECIQSFLLKIL